MEETGNMTRKRGEEFAQLVHQVLVMEKVANTCGITYDTFYARITNRVTFSAEELKRLIRAAPDPRFAAYLLANTPFIAAERPEIEKIDDAQRALATVREHIRQYEQNVQS